MFSSRGSQAHAGADPDVPGRYRWLPQSEIIDLLKLQPGMSVAEMGAGAGHFTFPVLEVIGSAGHAFAVETAPEMLASLRERAQDRRNIHVVEAPHHATPIATGSCDRVLIANLWAELPDPLAVLREAARLLREDGRLIIIEWQAGAQCPQAPGTRVGFDEMVRLLEKNTWDIHRHGEVGPYCYFLEAAVSDESVQS
jgi:ubiquinone/menaquinone biosynthesis C-methylase UbiE